MGLSPVQENGGAGRNLLAPPSLFTLYLATIVGLGGVAVTFVAWRTDWHSTWAEVALLPVIFLAVAAIAGEVRPLVINSREEMRTLSTSAPFQLALIAVAGVGIAVLVQAIASVADDLYQRRDLKKSLFNTAQYALSVVAGRAVYASITGVPYFGGPHDLDLGDVGALLIAGVAMIGVNWVLVAIVIALVSHQSVYEVLKADVRDFLSTNVVLLSVGGIAALVAGQGVFALFLLVAPVVIAHVSAASAAKHAHATTHDALTGLGNRENLHYDLGKALAAAHGAPAGSGAGAGLILLDLDHFKDVNDTLGHPVGDQILREVALRLEAAAPEDATVHRLGGDEFAVVVRGDLAAARDAARALQGSLDTAIPIGGLELMVRSSVGVAVSPVHGSDGETLLKNVDIALYHAKLERDRISVYSPGFDVNTVERLRLLGDLRAALEARQLSVVYQPQVDLKTGRTVGVEALVRWTHPVRGRIGPDEFIPLAENSGLIFPLTAFVLDTSLAQLAAWRATGHELRMAVNLSARHLSDLGLPKQVADAAALHGVPLEALVLEVTETAILSDPIRADTVIRALRVSGVEVSIDDYGTGNASLSYLKRLEIDELKVDRSFVSGMVKDKHDAIIVKSTVALALDLGLRVVAEGIEDGATTSALRGMGGVIGQGYFLGRPAGAADIDKRLEAESRPWSLPDADAAPDAGDIPEAPDAPETTAEGE